MPAACYSGISWAGGRCGRQRHQHVMRPSLHVFRRRPSVRPAGTPQSGFSPALRSGRPAPMSAASSSRAQDRQNRPSDISIWARSNRAKAPPKARDRRLDRHRKLIHHHAACAGGAGRVLTREPRSDHAPGRVCNCKSTASRSTASATGCAARKSGAAQAVRRSSNRDIRPGQSSAPEINHHVKGFPRRM